MWSACVGSRRCGSLAAESDATAALSIDDEIDRALQTLQRDELDRLVRSLGGRPPSGRVLLRMAERSLDGGDTEAAANALERAGLLELRERDRGLLEMLESRLAMRSELGERAVLPTYAELATLSAPRVDGAEGTLGVVLPLSGPFAQYGEASLHGVMLAAGVFGADEGTRIRLVVRDSGGVGAQAARAVRELAARPDVVAVIGPLLAAEAGLAAEEAERSGVPLVTLTSRETVASGRTQVLRLRTTPRDEVEPLVEHAMAKLGGPALRNPLSLGFLRPWHAASLLGRGPRSRRRGGGCCELPARCHRLRRSDPQHDRLLADHAR